MINAMQTDNLTPKQQALYLEVVRDGGRDIRIEKGAYEFRVHYRTADGIASASRAIYSGTLSNPKPF